MVHVKCSLWSSGSVTCVAVQLSMVGTSQQDDRWWLELMVDSATMSQNH